MNRKILSSICMMAVSISTTFADSPYSPYETPITNGNNQVVGSYSNEYPVDVYSSSRNSWYYAPLYQAKPSIIEYTPSHNEAITLPVNYASGAIRNTTIGAGPTPLWAQKNVLLNTPTFPPAYTGAFSATRDTRGFNSQFIHPEFLPAVSSTTRYPGCSKNDILLGGQIWASCNSTNLREWSDTESGWFFHGERYSVYKSQNGINNTLSWQGRSLQGRSWIMGPCSIGYRLPTRGEWETAENYARQNSTTVASLLNLPYNGSFLGYQDARYNSQIEARVDVGGAYWTSTIGTDTPYIMHLGSTLGGYRTDGTDMSQMDATYRWQHTENGMELVPGKLQELANVRCIRY